MIRVCYWSGVFEQPNFLFREHNSFPALPAILIVSGRSHFGIKKKEFWIRGSAVSKSSAVTYIERALAKSPPRRPASYP